MSSLLNPLRVVLCGRTTAIGKSVAELLRPEYEVIHFIQTFDAAQAELPHVLAGRAPPSPSVNDIGTHDYSKPIRAVVLGRAFQPSQVEELRKACDGASKEPVAWVVGDPAKTVGTGPPGPDYAKVVVKDVQDVLGKWKQEGGVQDGIIMY